MKRLGRVLVLVAMVATFIPAFAQSANAACNPSGYPSSPPSILVNNLNPQAGDVVVVSGSNWDPNQPVDIWLDGTIHLGTATADANGDFSASVTIPPGTSPGAHEISVSGSDCSGQPLAVRPIVSIVVVRGGQGGPGGGGGGGFQTGGAAAAPSGGNLPFTGSNISAGMLILFSLLIVGAVSLVAGRRRASHVKE